MNQYGLIRRSLNIDAWRHLWAADNDCMYLALRSQNCSDQYAVGQGSVQRGRTAMKFLFKVMNKWHCDADNTKLFIMIVYFILS